MMRLGVPKRVEKKGEGSLGSLILLTLLVLVSSAATCSLILFIFEPSNFRSGASSDEPRESLTAPQQGHDASSATHPLADSQHEAETSQNKPSRSIENPNNLCRGLPHTELWGDVVKWGDSNKVSSPEECCKQCRATCSPSSGLCKCNSWVYCADAQECGPHYGECWLKSQGDILKPDIHGEGADVPWTSGIVHGTKEGIIALNTTRGLIRIRLEPTWAPHATSFIRSLLQFRYCTHCEIYRVEGRGEGWKGDGTAAKALAAGASAPPQALVQGTFHTEGAELDPLPQEASPPIKRGFVCMIGSGPDFFISLADHPEWGSSTHSVFGTVLPEDMDAVVEKLVELPTREEDWEGVKVLALETPVTFGVVRGDTEKGRSV